MNHQSVPKRTLDSSINKIQQRQARVGIIGLGYVGLPLALLFTEQGFVVTGFDIDNRKVDLTHLYSLHVGLLRLIRLCTTRKNERRLIVN